MYPGKPFIDERYREIKESVRNDIYSREDAYILSVDVDEYARYLIEHFGLQQIVVSDDREMKIEKKRKMVERDGFRGRTMTEQTVAQVSLPVEPNPNIRRILELSPSTWSTRAPSLEYWDGWISTEALASESEVGRAVHDLKDEVDRRNNDIKRQNQELRTNIELWITDRRKQIEDEDELLERISRKVAVPLKKKNDPSPVLRTSLEVKEKLRPIVRPTAQAPSRLELPKDKFYGILDMISGSCLQFERTPKTFAKFEEEELRDVILSNLNNVFEGQASGEAFSKRGKTDIYLRIEQGGIFIAECKYWDGAKTIDDAVKQILDYLTWRDSYGVVIVFSKRKGFSRTLQSTAERIPNLRSYVTGFKPIDDAHFSASFRLPEDDHRLVELHFLVYNLCA